jgi:SAM-dependent methyltransferase
MTLGKQPKTTADCRELYDHIYRSKTSDMPGGPYGSHTNRDIWFVKYVLDHVPKGAKVLDASCGRGHLARKLKAEGYKVEGTEISRWLIDNELRDFPVRNLAYSEFDQIGDDSFDVVLSNDVLEHLPGKEAVEEAVRHLVRISRGHLAVCVSVGANPSPYARKLGFPSLDLHSFVPKRTWWDQTFGSAMEVVERVDIARSKNLFYAGRVKK